MWYPPLAEGTGQEMIIAAVLASGLGYGEVSADGGRRGHPDLDRRARKDGVCLPSSSGLAGDLEIPRRRVDAWLRDERRKVWDRRAS